MDYCREKTPYTRQRDAGLLVLAESIRPERIEHQPITASRAALAESLQWVRVDMEIRLLANRLTEAS